MWLTLLIYSLSILIPGWLILALWFDEVSRGFLKKLALAYGLGTMLLTTEIFLLVFILKFPIKWLWLVLAIEVSVGAWQYLRRFGWDFAKRLKTEKKNISRLEGILTFLIVWQIVTASVLAWLKPVVNWDSLAMWSFKAKVLFYYPQEFFNSTSPWFWQGQNHANYPWLVPLTQYWLTVINRGFDEVAVNFISIGFFVSIIFLLYGYLRNYLNRVSSLLLVWLVATMPLVSIHAYTAYADLPLAFYVGASFVLTYKWLDTKNCKYLMLAWLFLAGAMFTKSEAIVFVIAHLIILLLTKRGSGISWLKMFLSLVPALLVVAPWLGFKVFYKLPLSNVGSGLGWHFEAIVRLVTDLLVAGSWNIWWYIFFGLSLIFIRQIIKDRSLRLAYLAWCLALGGFMLLYLLTEEYQFVMDGTASSRNLLNFVPSSIFLLGLLLRQSFFTEHKFFKD